MIIKNNKHVIITDTKTLHFDFPKDVENTLRHETDYITNHNEFLAKYAIKTQIG